MDKGLEEKLESLRLSLSGMEKVLIAFSAGVDSTFLLKVAVTVLSGNVLAVTATSPTYPAVELKQARQLARYLGVRLKVIHSQEFRNPKFVNNSKNRCYYCKEELFMRLRGIANKEKIKFILDGSNLDDKKDFRPGNKAKEEFRVRSPLAEAGLSKEDIRSLSKIFRLPTWNKPALACLASRFPYGHKITLLALRRIEMSEDYLKRLGFKQVRLRHYDGLARIEVEKKEIHQLLRPAIMKQTVNRLKKLGYKYITVDLEGYRTGSMNEKNLS